jgi:hypothetical protein
MTAKTIHPADECLMKEKWGGLDVKLDSIIEKQEATLEQVQKTNGRVTALEKWRVILMTVVAVLVLQRAPDGLASLGKILTVGL